jgi:hypothetical protein
MIAKKLNDEQMRSYLLNGFVTITPDFSPDFHQAIFEKTESVFEKEGNPGNNLLPRIPEIQEIFHDPAVHGALLGMLGPNYYMHPHRHCHYNPPGSQGQQMHKDSWSRRRHHTRWMMALYYPQDTPEERGPTGIRPGSHYYNTESGSAAQGELPLSGAAGTVTIVHYDLWHRAMPNRTDKNRYMMKFLFTRMEEPHSPSWDNEQSAWQPLGDDKDPMWTHLWNWHSGGKNGGNRPSGSADVPELVAALRAESESACFDAAYALGAIGADAIPALMATLRDDDENISRNASYALSAIGTPALPALIDAATEPKAEVRNMAIETLGDIGLSAQEAIPALMKAAKDESAQVRQNAVEGLGITSQSELTAVPVLAEALSDDDEWVRRNASLALARLGVNAQDALPALTAAMQNDGNRYVRANSAHALYRMGTPAAKEVLLDFLLTARWCPSTTRESTF